MTIEEKIDKYYGNKSKEELIEELKIIAKEIEQIKLKLKNI